MGPRETAWQFLAPPRQKMTVPQCEDALSEETEAPMEVEGDQTIVSVAYPPGN